MSLQGSQSPLSEDQMKKKEKTGFRKFVVRLAVMTAVSVISALIMRRVDNADEEKS